MAPLQALGAKTGATWLIEFSHHFTSTETVAHLEFIIFGSLICLLLIKEPHGFARLISLAKDASPENSGGS